MTVLGASLYSGMNPALEKKFAMERGELRDFCGAQFGRLGPGAFGCKMTIELFGGAHGQLHQIPDFHDFRRADLCKECNLYHDETHKPRTDRAPTRACHATWRTGVTYRKTYWVRGGVSDL